MAQLSLGRDTRVVHCSSCGLIIGKDCSPDLVTCPQCGRVLRLCRIRLDEDDLEVIDFLPVESFRKRFVALYVSEAMVRFLLTARTSRPSAWEPLMLELEEERLKAFCRHYGWVMAAVYRDPGPGSADGHRPFPQIEADLVDGIANTILVTDPERVTRKDLHRLVNIATAHDAIVASIAPHPADPNLRFDDIDYDSVDDACADDGQLERLWSPDAAAAVRTVMSAVGWNWPHYAPDVVARTMLPRAFRIWRETDTRCRERGWRRVLRGFIVAQMRRSGDVARLPPPSLQSCQLCRRRFLDAALPVALAERVTTTDAFCRICLERAFFRDIAGAGELGPEAIDHAVDLDAFTSTLRELGPRRLRAFLERVLEGRRDDDAKGGRSSPSDRWLTAAREVEMISLGEIEMTDSYNLATDGHILRSIGAALVDNWLSENGLPHRRDVRYPIDPELNPNGAMRADFAVGPVLVEFLGLRGIDEFGKTVARRVELTQRTGVELIGIYAEDLLVADVMSRKSASLIATYRLQDEEIPE